MNTPIAGLAGAAHASRLGAHRRRRLSRSLMLAGLVLAFSVTALPASAANWWSATPSVSIGSQTIDVRKAGATGDGVHDDTSAFQAAINSLPSSGGTITVPAGRYMIDALRSINMRSHVRLQMSSGAQLVAIPNDRTRSYVIKVSRVTDVEISGGEIIGERARHIGSTGEWGMGIGILASNNVTVRDLKVSDCWGDGLYIGAIGSAGSAVSSTGVTINNVISTNNRRQGLSIGPVDRVYVVNSTFSNTNGTKPEAGIDIEPMTQGISKNVRIEGSTISGNAGSGVELQANVTGVVIKSSTVKGNNGFGIYGNGVTNAWFANNLITENGLDGVALTSPTRDVKVTSNRVTYNSTRWFVANNKSIYTLTSSERDLQIPSSLINITVTGNTLSPAP
ncbi:MAG: right-handed parallel beta-helix repeat-containing protein [Rhodanobacter sp.]